MIDMHDYLKTIVLAVVGVIEKFFCKDDFKTIVERFVK